MGSFWKLKQNEWAKFLTFCQTSFFEPKSGRISKLNLGADEVVGVFREGGVVDQAGAVHQVEEVAVVGPVVQQGQRLGLWVGLQEQEWVETAFLLKSETHVNQAGGIAALDKREGEIVHVAVDWGRVGSW